MSVTAEDTCPSISISTEPPGFAAVLASVCRLAAEHGITDERAILAEARDRWQREQVARHRSPLVSTVSSPRYRQ